jgi:hypothetical protein
VIIIGVVMALGLIAIEAVDLILTMQAEAAKGCTGTQPAPNASKERCFGHGPP